MHHNTNMSARPILMWKFYWIHLESHRISLSHTFGLCDLLLTSDDPETVLILPPPGASCCPPPPAPEAASVQADSALLSRLVLRMSCE